MFKMGTIRITPPLIGYDTVTPWSRSTYLKLYYFCQLPLNNELDGD